MAKRRTVANKKPPAPAAASEPQHTGKSFVVVAIGASAGGIEATTDLLRVHKPGVTHNGGTVALGPDGLLYAGFGDGGGVDDVDDDAQNCANIIETWYFSAYKRGNSIAGCRMLSQGRLPQSQCDGRPG